MKIWLVLGFLSAASGCAREMPKMEELVAAMEAGGVRVGPPTGRLSGDFADIESAANLFTGGARPSVRFLESENNVLITIYRFEKEDAAKAAAAILEKQGDQSAMPQRLKEVIGRQEIVTRRNFVVALRYHDATQGEKEALKKEIMAF